MSDDNSLMTKPKKIWNDALKMVKGEDSAQLIEQFTAEMTLVAEGLCEDQNKLRGEINHIIDKEDQRLQRQETRTDQLETLLEEQQREYDRIITELRDRLSALEKKNIQSEKTRNRLFKSKDKNTIRDLTWLIVVAAAAIIVIVLVVKLI